MMDIDKQLQTHLDALMQMEKPEEFGPAFVQRHCCIGYNNACHVLERGVTSGLLIQTSVPYRYKVAREHALDELTAQAQELGMGY